MNKLATIASILAIAATACGDDGGAGPTTVQISAPSGLTATTVAGGAHLTWMDNSEDEAQFAVQRKSGSEDWSTVGSVPANMTSYHDAAVASGAAYVYRVVAVPQGGDANAGAASNEVTFTAPASASAGTSGAAGAAGASAAGASGAAGGGAGAAGAHMGGQHG